MTDKPLPPSLRVVPPEKDEKTKEGREFVNTCVSIGRCLEQIEDALRSVNATAVVTDQQAVSYLMEARRNANKMSRELDGLIYKLRYY